MPEASHSHSVGPKSFGPDFIGGGIWGFGLAFCREVAGNNGAEGKSGGGVGWRKVWQDWNSSS